MDSAQTGEHTRGEAPKVSVVLPLYYTEDYIDPLLVQLRTQPLANIEIICVVDGSPDATLDIVKQHAAEDSRVQWLYQENAGAGAARNAGLALAHGEYLAFLDADDLYDPLFLSKMYDAAKRHDADLVICQFSRTDQKTGEQRAHEGFRTDRVPNNTAFDPLSLKNPFTDIASVIPHNKLYRRAMVQQNGLRFSTTTTNNDNFFALASVASSTRIVALTESLLTVRRYINMHSITSNRAAHTQDMFGNYQDLYKLLVDQHKWDAYQDPFLESWAGAFHYNATFKRNQRFIDCAVKTLTGEEPWCSMDDETLRAGARLNTGITRIKKAVASLQKDKKLRDIALTRFENEESTITEIIRLLNIQYGKHIPERSYIIPSAIEYVRKKGIRHSTKLLIHRLRWRR